MAIISTLQLFLFAIFTIIVCSYRLQSLYATKSSTFRDLSALFARSSKLSENASKQNADARMPQKEVKDLEREAKHAESKAWKSGYIFTEDKRKQNKGPWWSQEKEGHNPRIIPRHEPWWLDNYEVDATWKLERLQEEAKRRNLIKYGTKAQLIERINKAYLRYRLTDDNFTAPIFKSSANKVSHPCYPDVYDKDE